jgi:trimeric autotransporter adhesin
VTVAAGATTATFTTTTSAVASSTAVTITGNYNSGTRTATLTVNPSGGGTGTTALVQQKAATHSATSSVVVNLNAAPQPGSALALFSANDSVSISAVSGGGVSWVRGSQGGSHSDVEIWYGLNSSGSGSSVTVTYGGAGSGGVNVSEFSGVATSNALDVAPATTAGVSATPTTPIATTNNASDLILAAAADSSVSGTTGGPTNSFIALSEAANSNKIIPAYRIVTATGSYSTGWTEANNGWDAAIVALKSK